MNLDMILGKREDETDEPYEVRFDPETGKPLFRHDDEDWIHAEVMVNGQKQRHILSGKERRESARAAARAEVRRQRKGSAAWQRGQRQRESLSITRRQQLAILRDEIEVTPAMKANLIEAVRLEQIKNGRQQNEAEDRQMAVAVRAQHLDARRIARFTAGRPRGKDLREGIFGRYAHLLPEGYTGKRAVA